MTDGASWARGPIDTVNGGQVHIVARLASNPMRYYNLYVEDPLARGNGDVILISHQISRSDSVRPAILSLVQSGDSWISVLTGSVKTGYLSLIDDVLNLGTTLSSAMRFSISYLDWNLDPKIPVVGAWFTLSSLSKYYVPDSSEPDTGQNPNLYYDRFEWMFLPTKGSFWSNGRYMSGGITEAGCYTQNPYDSLIEFQDVSMNMSQNPSNGLPLEGCTDMIKSGWLNETWNYCVYTRPEDCSRKYWYSYASSTQVCGRAYGVCADRRDCAQDYSDDEVPLSCDPIETSPPNISRFTTSQRYLLLGFGGVVVAGIILSVLLFRGSRKNGPIEKIL